MSCWCLWHGGKMLVTVIDLALQDFSGQRQGWGGSVSYKKQF